MLPINDDLQIDLSEVRFRFTPSGGPGGQHANRSATGVQLSFDVARSPSLTEAQRTRLLSRLATRLDGDGVLHLDVRDSRSQAENRDLALERLRAILAKALVERRARRPTRVPAAAVAARLAAKRRRSDVKNARRAPSEENVGD